MEEFVKVIQMKTLPFFEIDSYNQKIVELIHQCYSKFKKKHKSRNFSE